MAGSAHCEVLVEAQNPSRREGAASAAHRKTLETSSCRVRRGGTAREARGKRCGENNGLHFRGHHGRTSAAVFFSERGLPRGTRGQRKTADAQRVNENTRKCRRVPWMLSGEAPDGTVPPVPGVVMPGPEALVRSPQSEAKVHPPTGRGAVRTDARM